MCGIFGAIGTQDIASNDLDALVKHAQQRGKDSSGLMFLGGDRYQVHRADYRITRLLAEVDCSRSTVVFGHSRLITNGLADNQPVVQDDICVFHNGIVVNHDALWPTLQTPRTLGIDTEVIVGLVLDALKAGVPLEQVPARILAACQGVVACAMVLPRLGKLCLFSNNGSLYLGRKNGAWLYASESFPLTQLGCEGVHQVREAEFIDIPVSAHPVSVSDKAAERSDLIPSLGSTAEEEKLLEYRPYTLRRCTRCILPETMPFISFDAQGVCNYCNHYKPRNKPRPIEELLELVKP